MNAKVTPSDFTFDHVTVPCQCEISMPSAYARADAAIADSAVVTTAIDRALRRSLVSVRLTGSSEPPGAAGDGPFSCR